MFGCHFLYFPPQKELLPFIKLFVQAADQDCWHLAGKRGRGCRSQQLWGASRCGVFWGGSRFYLLTPGAAQDLLDPQPLCLHILILVLLVRDIWELPGLGFGETFSGRGGEISLRALLSSPQSRRSSGTALVSPPCFVGYSPCVTSLWGCSTPGHTMGMAILLFLWSILLKSLILQ